MVSTRFVRYSVPSRQALGNYPAVVLAAVLALAPVAATAQSEKAADKAKPETPKVRVERRAGKKIFRIETSFVIEGRIQKPNAFYVLQRSQINYDWVKLKQDFVPRIVESVRQSPF